MFEGMDFSKMGQMLDQMQAKAKQIEEEIYRKIWRGHDRYQIKRRGRGA